MQKFKVYSFFKNYKLFFSIIIVFASIYLMNWNSFIEGIHKISPYYLFVAFIFCLINVFILGIRWSFMVQSQLDQSFFWHLNHFFKATFFNLITPAALGSDVYRLMSAKRNKNSQGAIAGFLIRERFIGLLGLCFFYLLCFTVFIIEKSLIDAPIVLKDLGTFFLFFIAGVFFLHFKLRWILNIFTKFLPQSWVIHLDQISTTVSYKSPFEFIYLIMLTLLAFLSWTLGAYFLTLSFELNVSFAAIGLVCVIAEFSRWLPLTLQGIGVRESVFAYVFSLLGLYAEWGFLVGALIYIINSASILLLFFFSIFNTRNNTSQLSEGKTFSS